MQQSKILITCLPFRFGKRVIVIIAVKDHFAAEPLGG